MIRLTCAATSPALLTLSLLAGCDAGTAPGTTQPVSFNLASAGDPGPAADSLALSGVRIVVGEASFGMGDQFGCADCQDQGPESDPIPALVDVPLDGSPVRVATERVRPGSYPAVEISVVRPTPELLAATPGWTTDATVEVRGEYAGRAFTLPLAIGGTFRERLATPVVISAGSQAAVEVTVTLPVASWFTGPSGPLDPNDSGQRAAIEANAGRSLEPAEGPEAGD